MAFPKNARVGGKLAHGSWMCKECHQQATVNKGKVCRRCLDRIRLALGRGS